MNLLNIGYLCEKNISYIPLFQVIEEKEIIIGLNNREKEKAKQNITKLKREVLISNSEIEKEEYEFIVQDLATNLMVIERIKVYRFTCIEVADSNH
ncbi:hypothetical protein ACFDHY_11680 [Staphylococcus hyicus]|uniref:hypothetical protein n=1 Tax=Staphylococcus hyicus TaxID=1284 RepID=UPI0036D43798